MSVAIKQISYIMRYSLQIKSNNHLSSKIRTATGITQGDCLSAILFIFYLSSCLKNKKKINNNKNAQHFLIKPKYAEDIAWITTSKHEVKCVKANISSQLLKYNLKIKKTRLKNLPSPKTTHNLTKCKILGSLIET